MYEKRFAKFTQKDMLDEEQSMATTGNLYEPIESNTGISGGWRATRVRADKLNLAIGAGLGAALAGAGAAYAFARARNHSHHK
jgi:hypothetical protein